MSEAVFQHRCAAADPAQPVIDPPEAASSIRHLERLSEAAEFRCAAGARRAFCEAQKRSKLRLAGYLGSSPSVWTM